MVRSSLLRRRRGGQPGGDAGAVAALDLPEQAPAADGVDEADVPSVRDQRPLAGVRVLLPDRFAPAGLVDADRLGRRPRLLQCLAGVLNEGLVQAGQDRHRSRPACTTVRPPSATAVPASRRRASVIRMRAGIWGVCSVNEVRGHRDSTQRQRVLCQRIATVRPPQGR